MNKTIISTDQAPAAIGPYSQAVKVGNTVYCSGQIPLIPETMEVVEGDIQAQAHQIFKNLTAVATEAGGTLNDFVKVNVYMTDLADFVAFNSVMAEYFTEPYPARAAVGVAELPKGVAAEVEGVMVLTNGYNF